jgi:hypothetical protein
MHRICISSSARKRINRITLRMLPSQLMRSVAHRAPARSSPFLSLPMQCKRRKTTPINQPRRAGRGCRGHRRTTAWGRRASVHRGAVRSGDAAFTPAGAAGQDSRASHLTPRVPGLNPGSCHRRDPLSLAIHCHAWNRMPVRANVSGRAACNATQPYHRRQSGAAPCNQHPRRRRPVVSPFGPPIQCSPLLFGCFPQDTATFRRPSIHVFFSPRRPPRIQRRDRAVQTGRCRRRGVTTTRGGVSRARAFVNAGVTIAESASKLRKIVVIRTPPPQHSETDENWCN